MTRFTRRSLLGYGGVAAGSIAAGSLLAGCGTDDQGSSGPAAVKFTFLATKELPDVGVVQQKLNDLLASREAGLTVQLAPTQDYDQAMKLAVASGSAGDLFFTAPWTNNYANNAAAGNLAALDDRLPQLAPKYWASLSPDMWNAAKFNGKIYGGINQQRFPKLWGFTGQAKLAEKYGLDPDSVTSYDQLEPTLAKIKQNEKVVPWATANNGYGRTFYPEIYGWDPVATAYGIAVRYDDADLKAFCWFDTPEFKQASALVRSWAEAGYTDSSVPTPQDMTAKQVAGQTGFTSGQQSPTNPQSYTFPTVGKCLVQPLLLNTDGVLATLTGISADSENLDAAVKFLELTNTDKEIYNLLCFGIEGTHYTIVDQDLGVVGFPEGVDATTSKYNPNTDWLFGNQFNAFYRNVADAKAKRWEVEAALNSSAAVSKAIGFSLDASEIKTEVAAVGAAVLEFEPQASIGLVETEKAVTNLNKALKNAGIDKILQTTQTQLDAFKAAG